MLSLKSLTFTLLLRSFFAPVLICVEMRTGAKIDRRSRVNVKDLRESIQSSSSEDDVDRAKGDTSFHVCFIHAFVIFPELDH